MSVPVMKDCRIIIGPYELSSDMNMVTLTLGQDTVEDTVFGAQFHTKKPGLRSVTGHGEGFVQYGTGQTTVDGKLMQKFAVANQPFSVCPLIGGSSTAGNSGDRAFFSQVTQFSYNNSAKVGDLMGFTFDCEASGPGTQLVAGTILEDGKTARTTSGDSTVRQLGAVGSTQKLYAVVHALAFTGSSVTFKVQSSPTGSGSWTDRITFSAISDLTNPQYATPVAGAITDQYWRVDWSGTFTTFNAVVLVGIQ